MLFSDFDVVRVLTDGGRSMVTIEMLGGFEFGGVNELRSLQFAINAFRLLSHCGLQRCEALSSPNVQFNEGRLLPVLLRVETERAADKSSLKSSSMSSQMDSSSTSDRESWDVDKAVAFENT